MKNFVKILAAISLAAAVSFAQEDENEDDSPWATSETQEEEEQESTSASSSEAPEEDAVSKVLAQKRAREAARKEQQANEPVSAIDQVENEAAERDNISKIRSRVGFGLHAAFDYSKLYGLAQDWDLGEDEDAPAGIGFEIALAGRFPLMPVMQFTPEIAFSYTKLEQEDESYNRNFKQMDLLIPLLVRVTPIDWLYLGAGVQLDLSLSNKTTIDGETNFGVGLGTEKHSITENIEQGSFTFGLLFAVGGYVIEGLSLDFRVYLGLNNMYPDFKEDDEDNMEYSKLINLYGAKMLSYKFGIGYWFM